jgi:hypothetical protein
MLRFCFEKALDAPRNCLIEPRENAKDRVRKDVRRWRFTVLFGAKTRSQKSINPPRAFRPAAPISKGFFKIFTGWCRIRFEARARAMQHMKGVDILLFQKNVEHGNMKLCL